MTYLDLATILPLVLRLFVCEISLIYCGSTVMPTTLARSLISLLCCVRCPFSAAK